MGIHSAHVVGTCISVPCCWADARFDSCGMHMGMRMAHVVWKHMGIRMNYMGMRMSGATISMAEWSAPPSWGQHASTIMQSVMTAEERGYPMEKELFDYVAERAEVLATNDASTQVTKDAAAAWEAAVAADASDEAVADATDKLLDVLEGRPTTIDGVIAFAEGPAKQLMGEEAAAAMLAEQLKRKEAGAKYCNCPSCTAASELLAKFGRIEL